MRNSLLLLLAIAGCERLPNDHKKSQSEAGVISTTADLAEITMVDILVIDLETSPTPACQVLKVGYDKDTPHGFIDIEPGVKTPILIFTVSAPEDIKDCLASFDIKGEMNIAVNLKMKQGKERRPKWEMFREALLGTKVANGEFAEEALQFPNEGHWSFLSKLPPIKIRMGKKMFFYLVIDDLNPEAEKYLSRHLGIKLTTIWHHGDPPSKIDLVLWYNELYLNWGTK